MTTPDQMAFDLEAGEAARDEGIESVIKHSYQDFVNAGRIAVKQCCETLETFTTDDVWALIPSDVEPHDRRAMVGVMKEAQKNHWAQPTKDFVKSLRPAAHAGPKRVWQSNIYRWAKQIATSYEEAEREPGDVNHYERFKRGLSPEMYRELYRDIPVERPREG